MPPQSRWSALSAGTPTTSPTPDGAFSSSSSTSTRTRSSHPAPLSSWPPFWPPRSTGCQSRTEWPPSRQYLGGSTQCVSSATRPPPWPSSASHCYPGESWASRWFDWSAGVEALALTAGACHLQSSWEGSWNQAP